MCVCDIAVLLNMTQSAISHQLRVLKQANLVKNRKEGKVVYYSLNDELKDYVRFKDILIDFRGFYDLDTYNLKQIDQYVWQLGKDYFPKNYGKKKTK